MAVRAIRTYPDRVLQTEATPVATIDATVAALLDDMVETMYAAPGIGLAAPQVGAGARVIVVDVPPAEDGSRAGTGLLRLINPEIVEREGDIVWEEGCLSVPDFVAEVQRSRHVVLRAWTPDEKEIEIEADGLTAVALQHELDHLDGKLFLDRLSRLKRDLYRKRQRKLERQGRAGRESASRTHLI